MAIGIPDDGSTLPAAKAAAGVFKTVRRRSVATDAIDQVKALVTSGALVPGDQLPPERVLSELLGVSRPTLREAVNALAAMGVVEKRQGSGTYVTDLSSELLAQPMVFMLDANPKALRDLAEVRIALETSAAASAAERIDASQLEALAEVLAHLRAAAATDVEAFVAADVRFHRIVHEASANVILLSLMATLSTLSETSRMLTAQDRDVRASTLQDHERIFERLAARDPQGAAESMRLHLQHISASF